jgi:O-methyltransferase
VGVNVDAPSQSRLAAAQAGLAAARAIGVAPPSPGAQGLRDAYLDLLKLSLCDLVGAGTTSVGRTPEGQVMARELDGEQLRLRSAGMDWPRHGLTMVGLRRLDDLQRCVEAVVEDGVEGDLIEAGAWRGGASILMRAVLDCLGAERTVWVADSFAGFPVSDDPETEDDLAVFDFLSVSLDEVKDNFRRLGLEQGVRFVPGFFEQTLPELASRTWSIVRLDADTYDTTQLALRCLYPGLAVGGFLIIDDYGALEECQAAVEDFRREHVITEPLEQIDWTGMRWRKQTAVVSVTPAVEAGIGERVPQLRTPRPRDLHVPSVEELSLKAEIDQLRARLAQAEAELESVWAARWWRLGVWLGTRLGRGRR